MGTKNSNWTKWSDRYKTQFISNFCLHTKKNCWKKINAFLYSIYTNNWFKCARKSFFFVRILPVFVSRVYAKHWASSSENSTPIAELNFIPVPTTPEKCRNGYSFPYCCCFCCCCCYRWMHFGWNNAAIWFSFKITYILLRSNNNKKLEINSEKKIDQEKTQIQSEQ